MMTEKIKKLLNEYADKIKSGDPENSKHDHITA